MTQIPALPFGRSERDRVVAGVCGGIAAALGVDATLVRLVFALLALAGGAGILLYLAEPRRSRRRRAPAPRWSCRSRWKKGRTPHARRTGRRPRAVPRRRAQRARHTIEAHVSSVLRKLQLSSRHELTRWAHERRLI